MFKPTKEELIDIEEENDALDLDIEDEDDREELYENFIDGGN